MEMTASARSLASIRPASSAFWWPRFRVRSTPENRGHSRCSAPMISQVRSREPSLTNITRLSSPTFPAAMSPSSLARRQRAVSGSTSSSL